MVPHFFFSATIRLTFLIVSEMSKRMDGSPILFGKNTHVPFRMNYKKYGDDLMIKNTNHNLCFSFATLKKSELMIPWLSNYRITMLRCPSKI